jgi:hypothetical protein
MRTVSSWQVPQQLCSNRAAARSCRGGALLAFLFFSFFLFLLDGAAAPAAAVTCTLDAVPGATLLLPYFEVDLNNPNGLTTLFAINNASASAILAHVVIWSDLSVPILNFNVYLTGYDVQTINLRDVIIYGNLPQTATALQDPTDKISPKGIFSQDLGFASCQGQLPPAALPESLRQHLQLALTGNPSPVFNNFCSAQALGDNVARGYITIDTVHDCTTLSPDDPGYFGAGGTGVATNQNVLWGTWFIANTVNDYVLGSNLIALEADAVNPATSTPGHYTFYGRYVGWSAADNREPMATTFATQYFVRSSLFEAGTDLIAWRDPKGVQKPFACPLTRGVRPDWYPLGTEGFVIFDEQEQPAVIQTVPFCPQPPNTGFPPFFPAATQRVPVNSATLPVPFNFGWFYMNLNVYASYLAVQPPDPYASQAFLISAHAAHGRGVAIDAFRLDSVCNPNHFTP